MRRRNKRAKKEDSVRIRVWKSPVELIPRDDCFRTDLPGVLVVHVSVVDLTINTSVSLSEVGDGCRQQRVIGALRQRLMKRGRRTDPNAIERVG